MKLRAFLGDIHGCYDEMVQMYFLLRSLYPGIEVWHLGDLVDRGPESGKCVQFAMNNFDGGILGNHEDTILKQWDKYQKHGYLSRNPDKARTVQQLTHERAEYMRGLPPLHVFDDVGLVIVHGGLLPQRPLYDQPKNLVIRAQMIKGNQDNMNRWWGADSHRQPKIGKTEKQNRAEGYRRWYKMYDHEYDCIYGHSVMGLHPHVRQNEGYGKTIGIDTGASFGGYITALIYPTLEYIRIQTPEHTKGKNVSKFKFDEGEE